MIATYRLQLTPDFGFEEAREVVPYLARLGVSHLYLSPITEARPGSTHGYDVVDHNTVRHDFGGRAGFDALLAEARAHDLQLILDFVPNHAGVGTHNEAWQDVLAYGPHAAHAGTFDIDWSPLKPELQGALLLPFLGAPYGEVLEAGNLSVAYADGRFSAVYFDHRFALAPATYGAVLRRLMPRHERTDAYFDLKDVAEAYDALDPAARPQAEALRPRLKALARRIDLAAVADTFDTEALHALFERQHWRLAYWKTAGSEINYRRFFDINGLAGLRMERDDVFWDAHRLLSDLLAQEGVAGVRIDHVDGLYDPHAYLRRLREAGARHVWVEKILAPGETPPDAWPIDGTTGYAFLNDALGVLTHPEGADALRRLYHRLVPEAVPFDEEVHRSKRVVMDATLTSEIARLAYDLDRLSEADYHTRDFTLDALRDALERVVAAFGRYRTYHPHDAEDDEARAVIREAVHRARQRSTTGEPTVFAFIERVLLGEPPPTGARADEVEAERRAWVGRFQQYTAPVAAKGVEDTAFYRYVPLASACEVGGEPEPIAQTPHALHSRARFRARRYPRALVAIATHDHKRGATTRLRMAALAEHPDAWAEAVEALDAVACDVLDALDDVAPAAPAAEARAGLDAAGLDYGARGPAPNHAYLAFQTLAALWRDADGRPAHEDAAALDDLADRLAAYAQKAARESKQRTNWVNPDARYEARLDGFVRGLVRHPDTPAALDEITQAMHHAGVFHGLSQAVLQMTTAGVPDLYQGRELPDLSLVDPDNRRPVDYVRRRAMLDDLAPLLAAPDDVTLRTMQTDDPPRLRFYVAAQLLQLRQARAALFAEGSYHGIEPEGEAAGHWLAFLRTRASDAPEPDAASDDGDADDGEAALVAVPRFPATFDAEAEARLPLPEAWHARTWRDALTGQTLNVADTLDVRRLAMPWAVLVTE